VWAPGRTLVVRNPGGAIVTDTKQAWHEVGDQFSGLGLKLKLHFEQAIQARPDDETMRKALEELRDSVDRAFDAVGNAVKDPSVKQDVKDVATSLREAFATTFAETSEDLRSCFTKHRSDESSS
jgi:hypothetical protein